MPLYVPLDCVGAANAPSTNRRPAKGSKIESILADYTTKNLHEHHGGSEKMGIYPFRYGTFRQRVTNSDGGATTRTDL